MSGTIAELGSQQDRNYRLDTGERRYVLKICHVTYETLELEAQNAAIHHIGTKENAPRVPRVIPSTDGQDIVAVTVRDQTFQVRLLEYLEGEGLTHRKHLPKESVSALGALCARLAQSLADFTHPGLDRSLQWDLRRAGPVAVQLLSAITDSAARDRIAKTMVAAVRRIQPLAPSLRLQAVHHDVTGDNVVSHRDSRGRLVPDGVIDFGDIIRGWLVGDLAVTCASLLHQADGDPLYILPAVKAYHEVYPLTQEELRALWPLVVARAVILVASSEQQISIDPENDYVRGNLELERRIFDTAVSVPFELMEIAVLKAVGMETATLSTQDWRPLLPDIDPATISFVDLGVQSPHFAAGNWSQADMDWRLLARAAAETGTAATRYGEYRLSRSKLHSATPSATFALHSDICLAGGSTVAAPFAGRVSWKNHHFILAGEGVNLHLDGIEPSLEDEAEVETGQPLGTISGESGSLGGLRVQLSTLQGAEPPLFCGPQQAVAWSELCPSPAALLGAGVDAPKPASAQLFALQRGSSRPAAEELLRDAAADGARLERAYVRCRGARLSRHGQQRHHSRPWSSAPGRGDQRAVAEAEHQFTLPLCRHCRILRAPGLTGARGPGRGLSRQQRLGGQRSRASACLGAYGRASNMLSLLEAYHGWSVASDAVSTSIADNPQALTTRPDWVHAVRLAQHLSRRRSVGRNQRPATSAAVADGPRSHRRKGRGAGRLHCRDRSMAMPAAFRFRTAILRRSTGRCAGPRRRLHRRRSAGGLRTARPLFLGLRAAGRRARHHHHREGHGQRPSARRRDHDAGPSPVRWRRKAISSRPPAAARSVAWSV